MRWAGVLGVRRYLEGEHFECVEEIPGNCLMLDGSTVAGVSCP